MKYRVRSLHWAVAYLLALTLSAGASEKLEEPRTHPGTAFLVSIEEVNSKGETAASGCDKAFICAADITSSLVLTPNLGSLLSDTSILTPDGPNATLAARRDLLMRALSALNESLDLSRTLVSRTLTARTQGATREEIAVLAELSKAFEAPRRIMYRALADYIRTQPARFGIGPLSPDKEASLVLSAAGVTLSTLGTWMSEEIKAVDREGALRAQLLASRTAEFRVRLGAFRVRAGKSVPVHVPGYDSYEATGLRTYEKITFQLTQAQQQDLSDGFAFHKTAAELIGAAKSGLSQITSNTDQLRLDLRGGVAAAEEDLKTIQPQVEGALKSTLLELGTAVAKLPDAASLSAQMTAIQKNAEGLSNHVTELREAAGKLQTLLRAPTQTDPVAFLLEMLGDVSDVVKGARAAAADVQPTIDDASAILTEIERLVPALSQSTGSSELKAAVKGSLDRLKGLVSETLQPEIVKIQAAMGPTGKVLSAAEQLAKLLGSVVPAAKDAGPVAKSTLSPASVFDVGGDQVRPVTLPILSTDAEPGDSIEVVLEVTHAKPTKTQEGATPNSPADGPIQEERRLIVIEAFGWSTASPVSTGVVFVKSQTEGLSNFEPAPVAVWGPRYRSRPTSTGATWFVGRVLQPRIGIHATTLNFSNDVPVELGTGVAVQFFSDLVQLGYGWNLSVKQDRQYWYLGVGLLQLVQRLK